MDENEREAIRLAHESIYGNVCIDRRETLSVKERPKYIIKIYDKNSCITEDDIKELTYTIGGYIENMGYDNINFSVE